MIAFSGLDGEGKSTQIGLLKNKLNLKGKNISVFWSRGGYTPGMEFFKKMLRITNLPVIPKRRDQSNQRKKSFLNPVIKNIWLTLSLLDLLFYYVIYIRVKELFRNVVICDRYIMDTLIDFNLNFPKEKVESWFLWRVLINFSLKPQNHFILIISVKEALYRSKLKNEPFPDSESTLNNRLQQYLQYVENNTNIKLLNCEAPIEQIHSQIYSQIKT